MAAIPTQDTAIYVADPGGSPTWLKIAQVTSISGPDTSAGEIDVTHLQSTAREYLLSLPDNGNITLELQYDPINAGAGEDGEAHEILRQALNNNTEKQFRIGLEDTDDTKSAANTRTAFVVNGRVSAFPLSFNIDDSIKASVTIRTTGAMTKGTY